MVWVERRGLAIGLSLLALVVLGLFSYYSAKRQLTGVDTTLFAVVTAVLGIAGAAAAGRVGRVDPSKARSAVRRLLTLGRTQGEDSLLLAEALESGDPIKLDRDARRVSANLLTGFRNLEDAIEDWNDVHPEALREVLDKEKTKAS